MKLMSGNISNLGTYELSFDAGKLCISLKLDAGVGLDELAKLIPGTIDDAILGAIKAALCPPAPTA